MEKKHEKSTKHGKRAVTSRSFESELRLVVEAWEVLPKENWGPSQIQLWLIEHMAPAIKNARSALTGG